MVTDANQQEFSRLELTKAAFDLSDRGIDGPRPARPGRRLPLHRARRLSPGRDGAADGHAARRFGRRAQGHAGDPDRQAARRQRVHALYAGAAGLGRAAPGDRAAEILAPRPVVGGRAHRSQGGAGRPPRLLGRGFRAREAQGRALDRRSRSCAPARRRPSTCRPTSSTARRPRGSGRERPPGHRRCRSLPRLLQVQLRLAGGAQALRAAADHPERPRHRRQGQVADRMAGRPGQGYRVAVARPDHRARLRAGQRPRHQDRQDAAAAHARRLSRHPPDLRGPLCARRHRHRLRPRRA